MWTRVRAHRDRGNLLFGITRRVRSCRKRCLERAGCARKYRPTASTNLLKHHAHASPSRSCLFQSTQTHTNTQPPTPIDYAVHAGAVRHAGSAARLLRPAAAVRRERLRRHIAGAAGVRAGRRAAGLCVPQSRCDDQVPAVSVWTFMTEHREIFVCIWFERWSIQSYVGFIMKNRHEQKYNM